MDEKALKRKRDEEEVSRGEVIGTEQPREGLRAAGKKQKKQKRVEKTPQVTEAAGGTPLQAPDVTGQRTVKSAKQKDNLERRKARKAAVEAKRQVDKPWTKGQIALPTEVGHSQCGTADGVSPATDDVVELDHTEVAGILAGECRQVLATASPSSQPESPTFDVSPGQSATSSISSIVPPLSGDAAQRPLAATAKAKIDPAELRVRLQKRIEDLRAARRADGLNGNPARNRQELMEARRRKEEQRRAHKKELRQLAKMEEQNKRDGFLASRNSPASVPEPGHLRQSILRPESNLSFGRVKFDDGELMDATLSTLLDPRKRRGPQDPLTAIKAVERKQQRVSGLDQAKRADIEEKEVWLNARKHAHGERVRDDTTLLKKTLKRKEKAKQKSEKEWKERLEGVEKGKAMRQRKRDDNLRKRRDERGMKGKKNKGTKGANKAKPKARPGFEGSFRAKVGGGGPRKD